MFRFVVFLTVISVLILRCHGVDNPSVNVRGDGDISNSSCVTPRGENGVCIEIRKCPILFSSLRSSNRENIHYIQKSLCGIKKGASKVCCATASAVGPRPTRPSISTTGTDRGNPDICGKPSTTEVLFEDGLIGLSRDSSLGNWPWIVSVRYERARLSGETSRRFLNKCPGILISKQYVLTIASCLPSKRIPIHSIRLGDLDLNSDTDGASPVDITVDRVILHPGYAAYPRLVNNIALIRLNQSVEFTPTIRPICLPNGLQYLTDNYYHQRNPFVVGWSGGKDFTVLQESRRDIINISICEQNFENFPATIDRRVLCANTKFGYCQSDRMGPLFFIELNDKAEVVYYLGGLGIVSFGQKCEQLNFPGVYTRIAAYID